MRSGKRWTLSLLVLGCSLFSTGCVDAMVDGVARGINTGMQTVVQNLVTAIADAIVPGE